MPPFTRNPILPITFLLLFLNAANMMKTESPHPMCKGTLYPALCASTLASIPNSSTKTLPDMIISSVKSTINILQSINKLINELSGKVSLSEQRDLEDCVKLFGFTSSDLLTVTKNKSKIVASSEKVFSDVQTIFSAGITNQYTCLDGLSYTNGTVVKGMDKPLYEIVHLLSNSLAMLSNIKPDHPKTATEVYRKMVRGFPRWVLSKDRKLLQFPVSDIEYDLVVAKDGSGDFTTISEAVHHAPVLSKKRRFVIYIKAGEYLENVEVPSEKINLMFIGDGMGKTMIKASRNVADGWTTFNSATVAIHGKGFIARDITIENEAGPTKRQAVALLSTADNSAFYRCSIVGYQDTLCVHSHRQFYKECEIYGTVDFVFGDAAVVLQQCNLYARKPGPNQTNVFTAQGRTEKHTVLGMGSAISIINCKLAAAPDLVPVQSSVKTYLGRPWQIYSTTVIMKSQLDDLIDPAGWLKWNATSPVHHLYYGEYKNWGAGSDTSNRVTWPGYRVMTRKEAKKFTVEKLIQGNHWLPGYNISYSPGI